MAAELGLQFLSSESARRILCSNPRHPAAECTDVVRMTDHHRGGHRPAAKGPPVVLRNRVSGDATTESETPGPLVTSVPAVQRAVEVMMRRSALVKRGVEACGE
ncbi:hypothetical protein NDU88_011104 [Pleurodeles waltl]|uniref:Uncharacterized protein n=1 Tax=Pleurodeles waltl TaxID=8319 RepID=A0AAV7PX69_PLEWA|nr:hypothetical protein NDU88_011104 [Pleurodeles waltl]